MSRANSLINTVNKLLLKFNATDRPVYKRIITRTGGDPLIGKPASITTVDTLMSPPPAVSRPLPDDPLVLNNGPVNPLTDYRLTVSSTMLSRADLQNKDLVLVFKDGSAEEELAIVGYTPSVINGTDVAFSVLVRSKKR